ncbi:MAG: (4-O-methyl)-D-glucuronate---lignin esterase, partial [Acidobacteriaceae bacterium]|nr:(4-O-methyl)-D-glucuronate---lignin esterase [Acidobacteriaceae bacterium]
MTCWTLSKTLIVSCAFLSLTASVAAQTQTPVAPPSASDRAAIAAASRAERDRELKLLGISEMQPGATAYDIGKPGNANYDESKANPYPRLPDVLIMSDGTPVKTPEQWKKRRAELKAMFDENVYGKYPAHIPKVTWSVDSVETTTVQGIP